MTPNFKDKLISINESFSKRGTLKILQVNLGNLCNQACLHCHANASPQGDKIMPKKVMDNILSFSSKAKNFVLDITGGCPEMNPHFEYFIVRVQAYVKQMMIRTNLTILLEPNLRHLSQVYKKYKIKLIASMPCYTQDNVDKQRGEGIFDKSINALKMLNSLGYGKEKALQLDLVYNPGGAFLPGNQANLEKDYKKILFENHGILFNHLLTITNAPISRFEEYLKANGNFDEYLTLLMDSFNRDAAGSIMCRTLLNVGWDGRLYDCDFNQALVDLALRDKNNNIMKIENLNPNDLEGKRIAFENHCYCCTAGAGSSCAGALL